METSGDVREFVEAMRASGVVPVEPIERDLVSGKLIRFRCQGDGRKRNGWAVFFAPDRDGARAGGSFGNYKQNTGTINWCGGASGPALSPEERRKMREEWRAQAEQRERERREAQRGAQAWAHRIWRNAGVADPDHPYAARKQMRVGGLRQDRGALLVPMRDLEGNIWNIQSIFEDGEKRFLKGARITGLFTRIGARPDFQRGVFVEGYATGDAISQVVPDRTVVVAFNTGNLEDVVAQMVKFCPQVDWVVAADDDHATGLRFEERGQSYSNPGLETAERVAAAHGCRVAVPPSVEFRRRGGFCAPKNVDFSDLFVAGRRAEIVTSIEGARRQAEGASLAERIGRAA